MHCAYTHGQTDTEQLTLSFLPPHLQKYTRGNEYRVSWVQPTLAKSLGSPSHNEHWHTYLCFSICIYHQGYMRLCSLLSTSDLIIKKKIVSFLPSLHSRSLLLLQLYSSASVWWGFFFFLNLILELSSHEPSLTFWNTPRSEGSHFTLVFSFHLS